jgi:hypothetical protein
LRLKASRHFTTPAPSLLLPSIYTVAASVLLVGALFFITTERRAQIFIKPERFMKIENSPLAEQGSFCTKFHQKDTKDENPKTLPEKGEDKPPRTGQT